MQAIAHFFLLELVVLTVVLAAVQHVRRSR